MLKNSLGAGRGLLPTLQWGGLLCVCVCNFNIHLLCVGGGALVLVYCRVFLIKHQVCEIFGGYFVDGFHCFSYISDVGICRYSRTSMLLV